MPAIAPVRFEEGRPLLLGGLRRRHDFAAAGAGIVQQWRDFRSRGELPGRAGPELYGVMCGADEGGLEFMCAVEVGSLADLPEGTGRMRVPAQRYAVFAHPGHPCTLESTWRAILEWLAEGEHESAHRPDFELYRPGIDPLEGPDGIEVWVGVVPRGGAAP